MSINNISGDLDQNGVVGQNDQELFTDILALDADGTIDLSDGIDADEATQLNEELSLDNSASDWNNLLKATTNTTTGAKTITQASLNTLNLAIENGVNQEVLSDLFEALGVANLDTADLDPDNISFEDLGEGVMTEACFNAVFDSDGNGSLTLSELTSASAMLQNVATSGVMGTSNIGSVFAEYASTDVFFTVDLDEYMAVQASMEAFVEEVGASSSWDLISNLITEDIDVGINPNNNTLQEIDLSKVVAFMNTVTALASSGVMGEDTSVETAYDEYLCERRTIDIDAYSADQEALDSFASAVGADSVWDLANDLIEQGIDLGLDSDSSDIQEIDLSKLSAFITTVSDLAASGVMGADTSLATAYDEYLNEGFTVDASDLDSNLTDLQAYLDSDERVSTVWELLVELNDAGHDIGLSATNDVVDLDAVSTLTTDYLAATIDGGAAGLISRINGSQAAENITYYEFVEASEDRTSFNDQELIVIDYLKDYATFKPLATNKQWITVSNLDSVIESFEPDPLF